jgi:ribosomal protein L7/L12
METNPDNELPSEVIEAIRANRKIEAIRLLREHWSMGLTEAKQEVDAYVRDNPQAAAMRAPQAESGVGRLILIASIIIAAYLAYRYFS